MLIKYGAQLLTAAAVAVAIGPTLAVTLFGFDVRIDGPLAIVIATIWLTALTNAINFMDGIDGLVGGVVAMACLLAIALVDATAVPVLACIFAGVLLGFLGLEPVHRRRSSWATSAASSSGCSSAARCCASRATR